MSTALRSDLTSQPVSLPAGDDLQRVQADLRTQHAALLPGFLSPALANELAERIAGADFYRREHAGIGVEACMETNATLAWLLLLVNDESVRTFVESVCGCGPVGHFDGRVYRLDPTTDHHDSWHSDLVDGRLVAMSINLGQLPYEGGALEIRNRASGASARLRSEGTGDALLFQLGEDLEHRVLPVTGATPRTVFAGWFKSGPELPLGAGFGATSGGTGEDRPADDQAVSAPQQLGRASMGNRTVRPSGDVVSRRVGDEVVLVHIGRDQIYSLNRTGARAWELLGEGQDLPTVQATLADEFSADPNEVERELEALISDLERSGLVETE